MGVKDLMYIRYEKKCLTLGISSFNLRYKILTYHYTFVKYLLKIVTRLLKCRCKFVRKLVNHSLDFHSNVIPHSLKMLLSI